MRREVFPVDADSRYADIALDILRLVLGKHLEDAHVRLWDGSELGSPNRAGFTLRVNDPGALRTALKLPLDLNVGRALTAGLLDCEGDVETAIDVLSQALSGGLAAPAMLQCAVLLRQLPKASLPPLREATLHGRLHSIDRDRAAIGFHYDLPVAFYQTFLDQNLVYSCAYYDAGVSTLEQAQVSKVDYILRKLRLQPGQRLLDVGCGWGALVVRAAKNFGANVLGITLSVKQRDEARRRIREAGLESSARVELMHYRELHGEVFDKIASVGMFEHVGKDHLPEYFTILHGLLPPGGLLLNHGIANQDMSARSGKSAGFMNRFIFPDGELVTISDALQFAEQSGFEVRDVENLREHYTQTLRAWVSRLESNQVAASAAADEHSYRAWRLYLAGSAQGFRVGRIGLYQALLAKAMADGTVPIPATRRDLYS